MALSCYILEGTWWSNREVPLILPYFQALANSGNRINLSHRTFRNADDIKYWVSRISKNERAFLYIASHGENQMLVPADGRSPIKNDKLLDALRNAKEGAIEFIHFGCCEMLARDSRRQSLENYLKATNAKWASGYSEIVEWLPSTFLDLALIADLAVPYYEDGKKKHVKLSFRGRKFLRNYEQLLRALGFSGAYDNGVWKIELFPKRHRNK
ncbi:MAG TPA: hypothetical protein ENH29_08390 [Bacteroidetes bacterium]|nr:hypothetical protein [Bacteroidota bacterium]